MTYQLPAEIIDKISYFQCDVQNFRTVDLSDQSKEIWIKKYTEEGFLFGNMVSHIFLANLSIITATMKTKINIIPLCIFHGGNGLWFTGTEVSRLSQLLELRRHVVENLGNYNIEFKSWQDDSSKHHFSYQQVVGLVIRTSDKYSLMNECIISHREHILEIVNKLISYTESAEKFLVELQSQFGSSNGLCYNNKRKTTSE